MGRLRMGSTRTARWYLKPIPILAAIAVWEALARSGSIPQYMLPPFSSIAACFMEETIAGRMAIHLQYSLIRFGAGFLVAAAVGIPLGILIGWHDALRPMVEPFIELLRPIPPIAWIPISLLWFGIGLASKAFAVFIGAVFPILLNTAFGVMGVERVLLEAAMTLGATKEPTLIRKVVIPAAMPSIITGLKVGLGVGWMCIIAAEMVAANFGLGYMIIEARWIHDLALVITYMLAISLVAYSLDFGFRRIEERVLRWRA
jgi:ABC-type nitrate/sulfonate/bicarbonate transport system permease component